MTSYNIYYGTIGKALGVRYRFTKNFRDENSAKSFVKNLATSFYYKNEGKFGLSSFIDIEKESNITGISIEKLYEEHIEDMMRYWVIPTDLDTIPTGKLKW